MAFQSDGEFSNPSDEDRHRVHQLSLRDRSATFRAGRSRRVSTAEIISNPSDEYDDDEEDKETFLIGTRGLESSNPELETYSTDAPLGAALVGAKVGETREYETPTGDTVRVTLVEAEPYNPDLDIPRAMQK